MSAQGRDDEAFRQRLRTLAERYPRYGYPTPHALLAAEGRIINRNRTCRLYREEGLRVRTKRRKKLRQPRAPMAVPAQSNKRWSVDFVSEMASSAGTASTCAGSPVSMMSARPSTRGEPITNRSDPIDHWAASRVPYSSRRSPEMPQLPHPRWLESRGTVTAHPPIAAEFGELRFFGDRSSKPGKPLPLGRFCSPCRYILPGNPRWLLPSCSSPCAECSSRPRPWPRRCRCRSAGEHTDTRAG